MKKPRTYYSILYLSLLGAALGYFFRSTQLSGGSLLPLVAFSVLLVLLVALGGVSLEKQHAYDAVFRRSVSDLMLSVFAGLSLLGCAWFEGVGSTMCIVLSMLGILAAVGMIVCAVQRFSGKKPMVPAGVFVILFYIVRLFRDFRLWEIDPNIADYCFNLFAMICYMLASYFAMAFCFDKGSRRRLAFFSLLGVIFSGISLAGAAPEEMCLYGGSLLWMFACAMQMLRKTEN